MWFQLICAFVRTVEFPTRLSLTISFSVIFRETETKQLRGSLKKSFKTPNFGHPTRKSHYISWNYFLQWIDSALVCNSINNDTPPSCILYPSGTSFLESFLLSLLYSLSSSSSSSRHNYFFIPFQIGTWIPFISTCKKRWKFPLNAWTF